MTAGAVQNLLRRALDLHRSGDRESAARLCSEALALEPDDADPWHLIGLLAQEAGDHREAVERIGRAVDLAPDVALYRVNLGVALGALGRREEAVAALREAVRLDPALPEAHHNLGNALLAADAESDALACFRRAALLRPGYPEALNNIGLILQARGETELAVDHYRRASAGAVAFVPALSNLCAALVELDRHQEAIEAGRAAVAAAPDDAAAHYNLGNALNTALDPDAAVDSYRRVLALAPGHADAWCNLGVAQLARNRPEAAVDALDRALALAPGMADANWNKALALLLQGRFTDGWPLYEARWEAVPWLDRRIFPQPEWEGEALGGRTVLVHTEQGYGDTLQFVRFLPEIGRRGGRVVLACQPSLKRLLALLPGIEAVVAYGEPLPPFDLHLPIMSLPRVIGLDRVPAMEGPYLSAPAPLLSGSDAGECPRIGIVWRGSRINTRGFFRSCRLDDLEPVLSLSGLRFFSLQVDAEAADRARLRQLGVVDLSERLGDFQDTAAAVVGMDLVVTVDTALAHLAGGLGVPVRTLLAFAADWRWLLDREDTPWYPTMRLYRQQRRGDWTGPVDRLTQDLAALAAARCR